MRIRTPPLLSFLGSTVSIGLLVGLIWINSTATPTASAEAIPPHLTALRPIKGISYQPSPSNDPRNGTGVHFDQDYWNTDFPAFWGTDGQAGSRNDLDNIKNVGPTLLHLYDWNAQRNHTPFLDAANSRGMKVMVPISNFTAKTIVGTSGCSACGFGYKAAFNLVQGIFNQVYLNNGTTPHPGVAMWGIFNEYDYNKIDPVNVVFVIQAILTLENQRNIPVPNRLPITAPVSFARYRRSPADERKALSPELIAAFERAEVQYLNDNPTQNDETIPSAVLAILALANALQDAQTKTSYQSGFDSSPVAVAAIPADFWKNRLIASTATFNLGPDLHDYLTNPNRFQAAFPGTTAFNTLPPLFFAELGRSQVDSKNDLQMEATDVLTQINCTHPLAVSGGTPQGYFLGSVFFQHTFVDAAHYEGQKFTGTFTSHTTQGNFPNQQYRVDNLEPLPVWASVQVGYANDAAVCPP